jgi:2-polyprenyl-3-methyl-5-hydroxy-6-metoxy-1,4-benzoquinol methylase
MNVYYKGWELPYFNRSLNFRSYQFYLIKKYIGGLVAEVGAGYGSHLKYYYRLSSKIHLFEPSYNLYKILKKKFKNKNIKIFSTGLNKNIKNKYNTIIYLDVLEHINNSRAEITKAYKALRKNGNLIISVPAFNHLFSKFDLDIGHVKRYCKKDFEIIVKKINAKIIVMKYYDSVGYFLSVASKLFSKEYKKNFKLKIMIWDKMMIISRLLDLLTLNFLGKSLLIIIKK